MNSDGKKRLLGFIVLIPLNFSLILLTALLCPFGGMLLYPILLLCQIILIAANFFIPKRVFQTAILSVCLIISTVIANNLDKYLWLHIVLPSIYKIDYPSGATSETLLVLKYAFYFGVIFTTILGLASIILKVILINSKKNTLKYFNFKL